MTKHLFTYLLLLLTYPTLGQKPLFDYDKEFAPTPVGALKPGEQFVIPPDASGGNLPELRTLTKVGATYKVGSPVDAAPLKKQSFVLAGVQAADVDPYGETGVVVLTAGGRAYGVVMGRPVDELQTKRNLVRVPGLIRLAEVEKAKKLLEGQTIYPLINYAKNETSGGDYEYLPKYAPVKVTNVDVGDRFAPVKLTFSYVDVGNYTLDLNYAFDGQGYGGSNPNPYLRNNFTDCFTLVAPRLQHDTIKESVWKAIEKGLPQQGMTKDECRLAMGRPADETDQVGQRQVSVWYYPDHLGRSWQVGFVDGKLVQVQSSKSR